MAMKSSTERGRGKRRQLAVCNTIPSVRFWPNPASGCQDSLLPAFKFTVSHDDEAEIAPKPTCDAFKLRDRDVQSAMLA